MAWWEEINRDTEIAAMRALVPDDGCLVLEGDKHSGREQAASIAVRVYEGFGYRVTRSRASYGLPGVKPVFIDVWKHVSPPRSPGSVPPWVAEAASLSPRGVIGELADLAEGALVGDKIALVLEDIDVDTPLPQHQIPMLSELATRTGWPVIAVSREESRSPWESLPSDARRRSLSDFSAEEVERALASAPELADKGYTQLLEAVDLVMASAEGGVIRPSRAYAILRAWESS